MTNETIWYHRLHGIVCFLLNDMTDSQIEEAFNLFLQLTGEDKDNIEELCLYHNCTSLYTRIRQYRAETGE
jgi:hypothetical protein